MKQGYTASSVRYDDPSLWNSFTNNLVFAYKTELPVEDQRIDDELVSISWTNSAPTYL